MAKLTSLYTLRECIVDEDGNDIAYYEEDLPHGNEIVERFINKWNKDADDFMLDIMNEQVGKDRIQSCYARRYNKKSPRVTVAVEIIAKEGKQFRGSMKADIFDFMESQYTDGWGEGFFNKIIKAEDGTLFYID